MRKAKIAYLFLFILLSACAQSKQETTVGDWKIALNPASHKITVTKGDRVISSDLYAAFKLNDNLITTHDYQGKVEMVNSSHADGMVIVSINYSQENLPTLKQNFYLQEGADYLTTDFSLQSEAGVSTNYMAPVCIDSMATILPEGDNRALFIPFDNDKWIRFQSHPASIEKLTSYEVTAVFNNKSRNGLVIGSVEHDVWKTAIDMKGSDECPNLKSLVCYGGVANETTRDSKAHGAVKGTEVKSPKVFVGLFDDWRAGMETYADENSKIAPPRAWEKAVPFGWNSWGVLQFSLNYEKAIQVSDFFKTNLQSNNFKNKDGLVYIGLDSGWNSFSEEQLKTFVKHCNENGQIAGVYWTPFADWGKNPERVIDDAPEYHFKDVYLYAAGKPQDLDGAYAIDPTHPAIEEMMKKTADLFHRCGFEYVKMDFMTHGALEADHWYLPEITTGMQAYNYGMKLLDKYFGDMYINLSISPIFPAQYAQSRRIACDAWNKIKDTEYTLNAVSYGWWIDRVYQFNDADHVVLQQATDGENRARVSSAVITGLLIAGDDFSAGGSTEGKEKAERFLTNRAINEVAQGHSFRPVEGNGEKSEHEFTYTDESGNVYYAVFNYFDKPTEVTIPVKRLGLSDKKIQATELWSGDRFDINATVTLPGKDVKFFKLKLL